MPIGVFFSQPSIFGFVFRIKKSSSGVGGGAPLVHIHWCHRWKNMGFQRFLFVYTNALANAESENRFTLRI